MIYKFALIFSIIFICFIFNLIKKNKLDEKYSILWIIFSVVIVIVSLFPSIIVKTAEKFNVYYPPSLLLLFGILIIGIYIIHITIVITKQHKEIVRLTQKLAILENENNKNK